jgi:hypothetical protein
MQTDDKAGARPEGRQVEQPSRIAEAHGGIQARPINATAAFWYLTGALEKMELNGELSADVIATYESAVRFGRRAS